MKFFLTLFFFIVISSCSFDNKSGIWKNAYEIDSKNEDRFKDFETIYNEEKPFNKIILPDNNLKIVLDPIKKNKIWNDEFYQNTNNLHNFSYKNLNELIFKSKKISRNKIKKNIFFDGENIIISDNKGLISVYSIQKQSVTYKYNFYKKKYKKLKINLNIVIDNGTIFVADSIGYLYALDYINKKLLWAENYKVPFRSNLKLFKDKIIISNQNNSLHLINKLDGKVAKILPTEETILKNEFINSLAVGRNSIFYLNTYGSLYSLNSESFRINWFVNLNRSLDLNPSNLFYSNPIIVSNNSVIVSTDPYLYILDKNSGSTNHKISISSIVKPIISNQYLFLITKDNLLVCININTGKIIYSLDISAELAKFSETKKKSLTIKFFYLVNNDLFLFLNNSYLIKFSKEGKLYKVVKPKDKLNTLPIFVSNSILYLNKSNNLIILD